MNASHYSFLRIFFVLFPFFRVFSNYTGLEKGLQVKNLLIQSKSSKNLTEVA
ncbi:hypothetical protein OBV_00560 [Oscillibacter valericigenes Sjm18-20]|nr:hypothetical protein OBV_00560 [Oscillibacter valericigenes Sjm18-20]